MTALASMIWGGAWAATAAGGGREVGVVAARCKAEGVEGMRGRVRSFGRVPYHYPRTALRLEGGGGGAAFSRAVVLSRRRAVVPAAAAGLGPADLSRKKIAAAPSSSAPLHATVGRGEPEAPPITPRGWKGGTYIYELCISRLHHTKRRSIVLSP